MITIPLNRRIARSYLSRFFRRLLLLFFPLEKSRKLIFPLELSLAQFRLNQDTNAHFIFLKVDLYHNGKSIVPCHDFGGLCLYLHGDKAFQMIPRGSFVFSIWEGLKELPGVWRDF